MCSPSHSLGQMVKKTMTLFLFFSFLPCILPLLQLPGVSIYNIKERREKKEKKEQEREKKIQRVERMIFDWLLMEKNKLK